MLCPNCQTKMEKTIFYGVEVDYCPKCLGLWFDYDELRQAKDEKDKDLNWLDIDLWKEETDFKIKKGIKLCPKCSVPLYEVRYGDSDVMVDVCNLCKGIWLDRGEFRKIIDYLRRKGHYEIINHYFRDLIGEAGEVFSGPEGFKSELGDFLVLLKMLNYKFLVHHPSLSKLIFNLPG